MDPSILTKEPSPDSLRRLLRYDCETGKLFWRARNSSQFYNDNGRAEASALMWNDRFAGQMAGTMEDGGYTRLYVNHRNQLSHRVIWAMAYGEWPRGQIDHIDHDRSNNRLENLRLVSERGNSRNRRLSGRNTSGINGVCWDIDLSKWRAQIVIERRCVYLGVFASKADAERARKSADVSYGFHANHGAP